jgi:hypothetical protein
MNQHINRRRFLQLAGASALSASALRFGRPGGIARANGNYTLADVILPPDIGQTDLQVFIPETGHSIRGSMLDYWRATGGEFTYGNPISEPFASADGYYSQAFEHAVFQYRPEFQDTEDPIIRLMPIGYTALTAAGGTANSRGLRTYGGGDRRRSSWSALDSGGQSAARAVDDGGIFDQNTGHTITGAFADWYLGNEGGFYLGSPLSQPVKERGTTVQYFEGGLLERDDDQNVRLMPLASEFASELEIDTKRVDRGDLPVYDESLFAKAPNPYPSGDESSAGRRWIEVSLSQQQLWAYKGWTTILTTYVSTGLAPNVTLPGLFHIRYKLPKQTMTGFTNNTGEVVAFGDVAPEGEDAQHYEVKDVPNVMYFSLSAEALHGTYWHNNFGNPMSHGCVNLPLDVAAWMYGWAPLGTMVWIHN